MAKKRVEIPAIIELRKRSIDLESELLKIRELVARNPTSIVFYRRRILWLENELKKIKSNLQLRTSSRHSNSSGVSQRLGALQGEISELETEVNRIRGIIAKNPTAAARYRGELNHLERKLERFKSSYRSRASTSAQPLPGDLPPSPHRPRKISALRKNRYTTTSSTKRSPKVALVPRKVYGRGAKTFLHHAEVPNAMPFTDEVQDAARHISELLASGSGPRTQEQIVSYIHGLFGHLSQSQLRELGQTLTDMPDLPGIFEYRKPIHLKTLSAELRRRGITFSKRATREEVRTTINKVVGEIRQDYTTASLKRSSSVHEIISDMLEEDFIERQFRFGKRHARKAKEMGSITELQNQLKLERLTPSARANLEEQLWDLRRSKVPGFHTFLKQFVTKGGYGRPSQFRNVTPYPIAGLTQEAIEELLKGDPETRKRVVVGLAHQAHTRARAAAHHPMRSLYSQQSSLRNLGFSINTMLDGWSDQSLAYAFVEGRSAEDAPPEVNWSTLDPQIEQLRRAISYANPTSEDLVQSRIKSLQVRGREAEKFRNLTKLMGKADMSLAGGFSRPVFMPDLNGIYQIAWAPAGTVIENFGSVVKVDTNPIGDTVGNVTFKGRDSWAWGSRRVLAGDALRVRPVGIATSGFLDQIGLSLSEASRSGPILSSLQEIRRQEILRSQKAEMDAIKRSQVDGRATSMTPDDWRYAVVENELRGTSARVRFSIRNRLAGSTQDFRGGDLTIREYFTEELERAKAHAISQGIDPEVYTRRLANSQKSMLDKIFKDLGIGSTYVSAVGESLDEIKDISVVDLFAEITTGTWVDKTSTPSLFKELIEDIVKHEHRLPQELKILTQALADIAGMDLDDFAGSLSKRGVFKNFFRSLGLGSIQANVKNVLYDENVAREILSRSLPFRMDSDVGSGMPSRVHMEDLSNFFLKEALDDPDVLNDPRLDELFRSLGINREELVGELRKRYKHEAFLGVNFSKFERILTDKLGSSDKQEVKTFLSNLKNTYRRNPIEFIIPEENLVSSKKTKKVIRPTITSEQKKLILKSQNILGLRRDETGRLIFNSEMLELFSEDELKFLINYIGTYHSERAPRARLREDIVDEIFELKKDSALSARGFQSIQQDIEAIRIEAGLRLGAKRQLEESYLRTIMGYAGGESSALVGRRRVELLDRIIQGQDGSTIGLHVPGLPDPVEAYYRITNLTQTSDQYGSDMDRVALSLDVSHLSNENQRAFFTAMGQSRIDELIAAGASEEDILIARQDLARLIDLQMQKGIAGHIPVELLIRQKSAPVPADITQAQILERLKSLGIKASREEGINALWAKLRNAYGAPNFEAVLTAPTAASERYQSLSFLYDRDGVSRVELAAQLGPSTTTADRHAASTLLAEQVRIGENLAKKGRSIFGVGQRLSPLFDSPALASAYDEVAQTLVANIGQERFTLMKAFQDAMGSGPTSISEGNLGRGLVEYITSIAEVEEQARILPWLKPDEGARVYGPLDSGLRVIHPGLSVNDINYHAARRMPLGDYVAQMVMMAGAKDDARRTLLSLALENKVGNRQALEAMNFDELYDRLTISNAQGKARPLDAATMEIINQAKLIHQGDRGIFGGMFNKQADVVSSALSEYFDRIINTPQLWGALEESQRISIARSVRDSGIEAPEYMRDMIASLAPEADYEAADSMMDIPKRFIESPAGSTRTTEAVGTTITDIWDFVKSKPKTFGAGLAVGGAFIAAGLIRAVRKKDHTEDDMQGQPYLPGGSPYSAPKATPPGIFYAVQNSSLSSSGGFTYTVSGRGSLDVQSLVQQASEAFNADITTSVFDVPGAPFRNVERQRRRDYLSGR